MAERRMFAKTIVLSDVFLDMPMSARCLYFTLGMVADDDGFVGAPKAIMRQCGASRDDLALLINKRFILGFESGVVVIKHWRINNYLQSDRKKGTNYRDEIKLLKVKENGAYTDSIQDVYKTYTKCIHNVSDVCNQKIESLDPIDDETPINTEENGMYTECIQNVYIGKDSIGKDSIGKDSIGKDSIGEVRKGESEGKKNNYQLIADMYNETCVSFPKLTILSDDRKKAIKARLNKYSVADFQTMFTKAEASDFLKGANNRNWQANFDWMIKDANMAKILDGNYDNKSGQAKAVKSYRDMSPTERLAQELDESYEMMRQWVNESEG